MHEKCIGAPGEDLQQTKLSSRFQPSGIGFHELVRSPPSTGRQSDGETLHVLQGPFCSFSGWPVGMHRRRIPNILLVWAFQNGSGNGRNIPERSPQIAATLLREDKNWRRQKF